MIKIFVNGVWQEYEINIPYQVNMKRDETLDNAFVSFLADDDIEYPPKTKVKINDQVETHWILENCEVDLIGYNTYEKTLHLIEPIELMKGYPLDNLTITQPLTGIKKTIKSQIERLLTVAITHKNIEAYKNLANRIRIVDDEKLNTECPELPFTENTLFDALLALGIVIDSVPKLRFIESGSYEYELYFEPLDILNKTNYNLTGYTSIHKEWPIQNYSDQIISHIYNSTSSVQNTFPGGDIGTKIVTEGNLSPFSLNFKDGFIQLPQKVKKITKFELRALLTDSWTDFSSFLYEFKEWQLLSPLSYTEDPNLNSTPVNKRQPYTAYYKMNDNRIFFGDKFLDYSDFKSYLNPMFWLIQFLEILEDLMDADWNKILMKYKISFLPVIDTKIKFGDDSVENFSTIANQDGNTIDSYAFSQKMRNVLKRMKHGEVIKGRIFNNYNEIPKLGHLVNNKYVITNISYERGRNYYDTILVMSEEYSRRSEFVKEKQEIRSWEIPADKISDRFVNYKDKISFSFLRKTNNNSSSVQDIRPLFPIFNLLPEGYYHLEKFPGLVAAMRVRTKDGTIYPLLDFPMLTAVGNDLLISLYANDNTIWGHQLVNAGTKYFQKAVTYTDEFGEFNTIDIGFSTLWQDQITENTFKMMPNATIGVVNNIMNGSSVQLDQLIVLKDSREIFKFTYQLTVEGNIEDETYITKHFTSYNQSTPGWKNREKIRPYIFFFDRKVYDDIKEYNYNAAIPITTSYSTDSSNDTFIFEFDTAQVPTIYQTIGIGVIEDGVKKPLIIQNIVEADLKAKIATTGKITLYCDY